jgi:hypothetical protein
MYEEHFTNWRPWLERGDHPHITRAGVYAIAYSCELLTGRAFSWQKEIIYVGMTNAVAGLKGRLKQFDNTIAGKRGHGGADRVRFKHRDYPTFCQQAYVAVRSFQCDPTSNLPKDLRIMGEVAQFEYLCLAHFVEKFGRLPEFNNKKEAPKFSLTVGKRTRVTRAT